MESESFGSKVKRTTKKVVRIIIILLILGGAATFSFFYCAKFDDEGVKSGRIVSISHKGYFFKTYEGTLNIETFGTVKGMNPIVETFNFSVEDGNEALIKEIKDVALRGEHVNLHFIERYAAFPWRGDTKNFAVSVERLGVK